MKKIFLLMITGILVSLNCFAGEVIYITENGSGDNSGYSWDNAMPGIQLQDAIDTLENSGGEIWVAEGTYIPQKKNNYFAALQY